MPGWNLSRTADPMRTLVCARRQRSRASFRTTARAIALRGEADAVEPDIELGGHRVRANLRETHRPS